MIPTKGGEKWEETHEKILVPECCTLIYVVVAWVFLYIKFDEF